jgi:hypothetical protein
MKRWKGLLALLLMGGCGGPKGAAPEAATPPLLRAAHSYRGYGRVDDDLRVALSDCRAPAPPRPRLSASGDLSTHGKKLYTLFAKDRLAYLHARESVQPEGQVLVKESWIPGEPRTRGPLFLMMKAGGTWTYATASPDGRTLTASGQLPACRKCHESESTHDRLFGLTSGAAAE